MKRRNANRIAHNLRRNCRNVTEGKGQGKIEVTGGRGKDGSSYWMTSRKRKHIEK
jgi:hypothetical protein